MSLRQLAGVALIGAAGWALWRRGAITLPGISITPPGALPDPAATPSGAAPSSFTSWLVGRESGGDVMAKNPRSSASGKYQFTRDTWVRLGGAWGSDPSKPFGGLAPSEAEQDARYEQLTRGNRAGLERAGLAVTNATLYAAHFLGLGAAVRVLTAPPSAQLAALVGSRVMKANPHLRGFTVADFKRWLERR